MRYVDGQLLVRKSSFENYLLSKMKKQQAKDVEAIHEITNEEIEIDNDIELTEEDIIELDEAIKDLQSREQNNQLDENDMLIKKNSLVYRIFIKLTKAQAIEDEAEEVVIIKPQVKKDEPENYKNWGETQFDGEGIKIEEEQYRMIGFSKDKIKKVKI